MILGQAYVFQIFPVASRSMAPTLLPEDYVLVDRLVYDLRSPHRGDLVVFRFAQTGDRLFLKRIVGLPGDIIEERGGQFRVEPTLPAGAEVMPQASQATGSASLRRRVPPGELFVLGDNPGTSLDSRTWGTVKFRDVVGKALLICWSHGVKWWDVRWQRIGRWLH